MVPRDVILLGIFLVVFSFSFGIYLYEVQKFKGILVGALTKSAEEGVSDQGIYEVKYSEEEAKDWIYLGMLSETLSPGETSSKYIAWQRGYSSKIKLDITTAIMPSQYYTCSWYECVDCSLYSYQYCSQYKCVVQAGTPYAICERDEIRQWKCTKTITEKQEIKKEYIRTATVKDGPDVFDWWDPDYIEFPIGDYPWDALVEDSAELEDYYIWIRWQAPVDVINCIMDGLLEYYGPDAYDLKIIYEDGTEDIIDVPALAGDPQNYELHLTILRSQVKNKKIERVELWEEEYDISQCYPQKDETFTIWVDFVGYKEVESTDVQYATKSQKEQLEAQGYTCEPYEIVTTTKSFNGISSCDVVQYTTDQSKDGKCKGGVCYWYCNSEYECSPSPPRTKESGTHTETETYIASNKEELYNKGCSDADISCISWSTKTGSLSDYQNDEIYRDARNPSCSQWSSNTYRSTIDRTKLDKPPFTQCIQKTNISENKIENAICTGPFQDTVSQPAELEVKNIKKQYYATTSDTIYIDVNPHETVYINLKGAKFTNVPNKGHTSFSIKVEALELNPYIISQSTEDITPEGATYKAKRYVAVIYSPGDLIARFYPPVCSEFEAEDLKYRYASINNVSLNSDPCSENGILLYLNKGNNRFEMIGYSINPSLFESCTKKPNTCEEEDLYGCPEQCKVKDLEITCPSTLTISGELGKEVKIPITIIAGSEGIVRISVEGEGAVFIPKEYRLKIGTNPITLEVTNYLQVKESKRVIWKIIVENPAIKGISKIKPEYKYCEIRVTVIPPGLWDILKRPEVIISFVIIIVGLLIMLLGKGKSSK